MNAGRTLTAFPRIKRGLRAFGIFAALLLGGCGGPSGSDIKSAMQEASNAVMGERLAPSFEDVTDVNCREAQGKPGFICSFNATSYSRLMKTRSSQIGEARFV